jgi:gas vesicle protein
MNRTVTVAGGLLFGAMLAGGLVLLFAPRSGAETQQAIRDRVQAIVLAGQEAAEARRIELTERFEALKEPVAQV